MNSNGLIEVVGAGAAMPVSPFVSPDRYRRSIGLMWDNDHSRRLRLVTGDDKLGVAWSPTAINRDGTRGCWVIGRKIRKHLMSHFGRKEFASEVEYFHIWDHWTDPETGSPRVVTDPRLELHLRRCDGWRRKEALDADWERQELEQRWRDASDEREMHAGSKEMVKPYKALADERCGFVGREGAGGERKHFYAGCLRP